jgi:hypothetical protein
MEKYEGVDVELHTFLILMLDEGEQSVLYPGHLTPSTHKTGG